MAIAFGAVSTGCSGEDQPAAKSDPRVLVFSRTLGFRHDSIPAGLAAIRELGVANGFVVDATEDPAAFGPDSLTRYRAVIFLSTTGDVLNDAQQIDFERYVRSGGGFVGVHAAADTEYNWPWYGELIGAWFLSHPAIQDANVNVVDRNHPSTGALPPTWRRRDEWYNFRRDPSAQVRVLLRVDESSYVGGTMGINHPISWAREIDSGRSWYTAMGHTSESFAEPLFREHLLGGIRWAGRLP
jgi:type 1 glutamine amidotransferase